MNPVDRVVAVNTEVVDFAEAFRQYNVISLEQSVKTHNGRVNMGRILVKFDLVSMPLDHLLEILGSLDFPVEYMYWLYNQYNNSTYIMMALDTESTVYRLYFERRISRRAEPEQPHECINSVKWRRDHMHTQRTRYYSIITRDINLLYGTAESCGISRLPEFATDYLEKQTDHYFMFANDLGTDRMSICIPFRTDTIYTREITEFTGYPMKWYQTGRDKDNNVFDTYYFSIYRNINE